MSNNLWILLAFGAYLALMMAIGVYSMKRSKTSEDYFLGGRSMGPYVTAMSAQASDMSGWLLMGFPGSILAFGFGQMWIGIGLALGTALNWIFIAKRLRRFSVAAGDSITIPQYLSNRFASKSPVLRIVCAVVFFVCFTVYVASGFKAGGILFAVHLHKKKRTSARMLKKIDDMDYRWNEEVLDQRVKDVYFAVQQAWSDMDRDTLKELLSEDLYDRWCTKLSFMEISHEKNILKDIELLDLKIVSVNDFKDDTKDFCWYYIKGKMIDYTIDTDSNEYKEGSSIAETFVEYWRFTRRNGIFVLDEVAQKNEKDLTQFTDYSEDLSDQEK